MKKLKWEKEEMTNVLVPGGAEEEQKANQVKDSETRHTGMWSKDTKFQF